ncbi:MAG: RNA polymerase sigma-70 factor (ECF subfamily) [Pseudohongiellaceae bacterium]|jgi:RNA polymerase sigma-70 factor (ECF subfamily)
MGTKDGEDAGAVHWLDEGLRRRLAAHARRYVGDASEAEDIAQETLMRVDKSWHRLRTRGRIEAWMFRICRHAAIDYVRARKVRRGVWGSMPEDAEVWGLVTHEQGAAVSELDDGGLSASQRLLLGLHYEKGLSQPDICSMTGLSAPALRVRLFRARRALRQM